MLSEEEKVFETIFYEKGEFEGRECNVARINYLEVLNVRQASSQSELEKLKGVLLESEKPEKEIEILMGVRNWRPHLIDCLAALLVDDKPLMVKTLWETFDRSSWVNPQIAATLSILDKSFIHNALERLRNGVLVKNPSKYMIDAYKTDKIENPKGFMSLWGLLETVFNCDELSSPNMLSNKEIIGKKDRDNSAIIALSWRNEIKGMLNA
ncbi:MAG: hypothetical protein P8Y45_12000 [Exilibacterium sp.]